MDIKIATNQEVAELAALADEIWHEYFPQIISNEQIKRSNPIYKRSK